jgi:hypothetical protein
MGELIVSCDSQIHFGLGKSGSKLHVWKGYDFHVCPERVAQRRLVPKLWFQGPGANGRLREEKETSSRTASNCHPWQRRHRGCLSMQFHLAMFLMLHSRYAEFVLRQQQLVEQVYDPNFSPSYLEAMQYGFSNATVPSALENSTLDVAMKVCTFQAKGGRISTTEVAARRE